jgi:hypothetical protein
MKTPPVILNLVACLCLLHAAPLAASAANIRTLVVAERSTGQKTPAANAGATASVSVYDGGFIEAGDSIAGDKKPDAAAVAAALSHALREANLEPSAHAAPGSLVLIYHWGVLRPRQGPHVVGTRLDPNFKARLALVATAKTVRDLEQDMVTRHIVPQSSAIYTNRPSWRDALDFARDPRYFVIISAYDVASLKENAKAAPVWRVEISTQETSNSMANAIPAMAASAGKYLGRDLDRPQTARAALYEGVKASSGASGATSTEPADFSRTPDEPVIRAVMKREHDRAAGEFGPEIVEEGWR